MSNVWETRARLFLERLDELTEWLSNDAPREPAVLEEQTVRLLAMAVMLLRQHQVNSRGRCRCCERTTLALVLSRRRRCTVHQVADFAMGQSLDVLWWRIFETGEHRGSLAEVRAWVAERTGDTGSHGPAETAQESDEGEPTIEWENPVR